MSISFSFALSTVFLLSSIIFGFFSAKIVISFIEISFGVDLSQTTEIVIILITIILVIYLQSKMFELIKMILIIVLASIYSIRGVTILLNNFPDEGYLIMLSKYKETVQLKYLIKNAILANLIPIAIIVVSNIIIQILMSLEDKNEKNPTENSQKTEENSNLL